MGFGDYVPTTVGGKIFTLFYVPFAVIFTAGAINHVACVPLRRRKLALENYVLEQFGENMSLGDFEDIRRCAGLKEGDAIRPNDFLLAMLVRLGNVTLDDTIKIRRLFAKLDRDCSGTLDSSDIEILMKERRKTANLCDITFDPHEHHAVVRCASNVQLLCNKLPLSNWCLFKVLNIRDWALPYVASAS
eukprot:SAG11_NODE_447_length_9395_cov_4.121665_4_plen_189_part_00